MKILVTGGAGFIGSAVVRHIINDTNDTVLNLDKLGNSLSLLFSGISPFLYFPESTPNPRGEYANNPTFSLLHISALPTSKSLFKSE